VFCAIGNHEKRFLGNLSKEIENTGAILLDNSHIEFMGVKIGGLTSGHDGKVVKGLMYSSIPNLTWLNEFDSEDGFKILLCHHPEYFDKHIKNTSISLTLSGHAHGGQWRIFNRGVLAPGQGIFPKYTYGMYEGKLIVSRGVGNPHFIPRINNKPEIILLMIEKEEKQ
jgi:predicted MPP superfamily phosphohydrolase